MRTHNTMHKISYATDEYIQRFDKRQKMAVFNVRLLQLRATEREKKSLHENLP